MHITRIHTALTAFLAEHYPDCPLEVFQLTIPPEKKLGDVCINIFGAVKQLRTSPQVLGEMISQYFLSQVFVIDVQVQ